MAQIARFRPVFYVFEAKREAQSAGHMLLTKRAARAQRGSRVHHPQGCIICVNKYNEETKPKQQKAQNILTLQYLYIL